MPRPDPPVVDSYVIIYYSISIINYISTMQVHKRAVLDHIIITYIKNFIYIQLSIYDLNMWWYDDASPEYIVSY